MAKIKRFLFNHGEKVGFAIIALLCLWSISGNVFRDGSVLELPEGKTFKVDPEEIDKQIKQYKKHLNRSDPVVPPPKVQPLTKILIAQKQQYKRQITDTDFEWVIHNRPPARKLGEIIPPPLESSPPDPKYITAIVGPIKWKVTAGEKANLITCSDAPLDTEGKGLGNRWIRDGRMYVALFVKRLGTGKGDLDTAVAGKFRSREAGGVDTDTDTTRPDDGGFPAAGGEGELEFGFGEPKKKPEKAPEKKDAPDEAPSANLLKELEKKDGQQDRRIWRNLATILDGEVANEGWVRLSSRMITYKNGFDEEQLKRIWEARKLPKSDVPPLVERAPKKAPEKKDGPEKDAPKTAPKEAAPRKGPLPPPPPGTGAPPPPPPPGDDDDDDDDDDDVELFEPRFHAWLHNDVEENTVYLYRLVAYAMARDIPALVREDPRHAEWDMRCELGDASRWTIVPKPGSNTVQGYYALTQDEFKKLVTESGKPNNSPYISRQPRHEPVPEVYDINKKLWIGMRRSDGSLTARGGSYLRRFCFSRFTYTDVVLTPVRQRILFTVIMGNGSEASPFKVTLKVVLIEEGKQVVSKSQELKDPVTVEPPLSKWIKIDPLTRKAAWDKTNKTYKLVTIHEYYSGIKGLNPRRIGKKETRGKKELDFRTQWELVDVKKCEYLKRTYKTNKEGTERELDENNKPIILNELPVRHKCIVVRQRKVPDGKIPRYRYILMKTSTPDPVKEEIIPRWESERDKMIEEKAAVRRALEKAGPSPEAEAGKKTGEKAGEKN